MVVRSIVAGGTLIGNKGRKSAAIKAKVEKEFYPLVHQLEHSIHRLNNKWKWLIELCTTVGRKYHLRDRRDNNF